MAAPPTAAAAVAVATVPFMTSRRDTSICNSSLRDPPRTTRGRQKRSREAEHRDAVGDRCGKRVPERTSAETHPEDEDEGGADDGDEEPVAARGRKPENALARHLRA